MLTNWALSFGDLSAVFRILANSLYIDKLSMLLDIIRTNIETEREKMIGTLNHIFKWKYWIL